MKLVNKDTGSLPLPKANAVVGTKIQIVGENKTRTVTYVMQSKSETVHCCFKGTGPLPVGEVEFEVVEG